MVSRRSFLSWWEILELISLNVVEGWISAIFDIDHRENCGFENLSVNICAYDVF